MRLIPLVLLLLLPACSMVQASQTYQGVYNGGKEGLKADSKPVRMRLARLIYPDDEQMEPTAPPKPKFYCYATIANADCYKEPLSGEEARLIQ